MKSWHQSSVDLDNYPLYRQSMQRHYDAVLPAGTEVHFTGVPVSTWAGLSPSSRWLNLKLRR